MFRILDENFLDVIPLEVGFLYVAMESLPDESVTAAFYVYDQEGERTLPIKSRTYLEAKFGSDYKQIVSQLGDYISCEASMLKGGGLAALFDDGEMTIFDKNSEVAWKGTLTYQDASVRGLELDDECFWCTVPDKNAIIRYSPIEKRVLLRIGGGASTAFNKPVSVTKIDDHLYICNKGSSKIRTIRLSDYAVKDYKVFDEPVYKYFKIGNTEYAVLESGLYCLTDN